LPAGTGRTRGRALHPAARLAPQGQDEGPAEPLSAGAAQPRTRRADRRRLGGNGDAAVGRRTAHPGHAGDAAAARSLGPPGASGLTRGPATAPEAGTPRYLDFATPGSPKVSFSASSA